MATLEKIRSKAGLLVIVVGLALFAFIIGDFLNSGSTYFRQTQERIASVDGEVINIQDYQSRIDEMVEVYKMQTGNSNLQEEMMTQVRQSVFDAMVREIVLDKEAEKLGLEVSSQELFDMVQGENISPMVQQMPMFANQQTGQFDKTTLLNFLKMIDDDNINNSNYPADQQMQLLQWRSFWLFWEKNIKRQRLEEKYTTLLTKALSANTLEAKDNYKNRVESSDFEYAMQTYASIADSLVTVSKSEIEKRYNQRKESYKQQEAKVISYITVDIVPSTEDFEKAQADINSLRPEFEESANVAELVNENSDIPYMDVFFSEAALDPDMKQFATTSEIGAVEGPIFEENTYRMFKLIDKTKAPDSVKVSHIMLAGMDEAATVALTDSLMGVLKNADFAAVAAEYSVDQSAQNGGELGWFTEAAALRGVSEEFRSVVFSAAVNEIKIVKSQYGTHIVKVTEKTAPVDKYKIADITMNVAPSSKTYSNLYNDLNQYISQNNTLEKFQANAQEKGLNLVKEASIGKNDELLGFIKGSRPVLRWAFQNKKGAVSDIFECDDKFIVAVVHGTVPEGYRSLASVTPQLQNEIRAEKKGEMIVKELKEKNLTSLQAYADAMDSSVSEVKFVAFNTQRIANIGLEPKLNAFVSLAPVGQLSQPVAGNGGVYVFQVSNKEKEEGEYVEAEELKTLNSSNAYRYGYMAVQSLINKTKIEDNRIRFY